MIKIDLENNQVTEESAAGTRTYALDTPEAFAIISRAWLRAGWDTKYVYSFTWFGRPVIQLPEDMMRLQELVFSLQPDLIIETGIAHGGSLVFYASLCRAMSKGRVVGIDVEIRPHNRKAIEAHPLSPLITLVEGNAIAPETIARVKAQVKSGERVVVFLDSCHDRDHVLGELEAYAPLVSVGSYIVAMDGIRELVVGGPRTKPDWTWNNPKQAAKEFVHKHSEFFIEEPPIPFNEGVVKDRVTYFPGGFIKRLR